MSDDYQTAFIESVMARTLDGLRRQLIRLRIDLTTCEGEAEITSLRLNREIADLNHKVTTLQQEVARLNAESVTHAPAVQERVAELMRPFVAAYERERANKTGTQ
jgi:hypothetical protein